MLLLLHLKGFGVGTGHVALEAFERPAVRNEGQGFADEPLALHARSRSAEPEVLNAPVEDRARDLRELFVDPFVHAAGWLH